MSQRVVWMTEAPVASSQTDGMSPSRTSVVVLALVLAACSSSSTTTAPSSTAAPTTGPIVVANNVTTTAPEAAAQDAEVARPETELATGTRYVHELVPGLLSVEFEVPLDGAQISASTDLYAVTDSSFSTSTVLGVVSVRDGARAFADPYIPSSQLSSPADLLEAMPDRVPIRFLEWFDTLPFIDATPIRDVELAGQPARTFDYTVAALSPEAEACEPTKPCAGIYFNFDSLYYVIEGDRGTKYELTVAGVGLDIEVPDTDEARAFAESLEFVVSPVAEEAADLVRLPQWGTVPAGTEAAWLTSAGDTFTITMPDRDIGWARAGTFTNFVSPRLDEGPAMVALIDPATGGFVRAPDAPLLADGEPPGSEFEPLPDDLVGALTSHPAVEVLDEARSVDAGALTVTSIDVRALETAGQPCADDPLARCARVVEPGVLLRSDATARVSVYSDEAGTAKLVVVSQLGTVADAVVPTIRFVG